MGSSTSFWKRRSRDRGHAVWIERGSLKEESSSFSFPRMKHAFYRKCDTDEKIGWKLCRTLDWIDGLGARSYALPDIFTSSPLILNNVQQGPSSSLHSDQHAIKLPSTKRGSMVIADSPHPVGL